MEGHWFRTYQTPNANPKRTRHNKVLLGAQSPYEAYKKLISEKDIKVRKNAVYAIEFVVSFSPNFIKCPETGEYIREAKENLAWWRRNTITWLKKKFGDRCTSAIIHYDESTPHIHALITPIEEKTRASGKRVWTLNARGITGGRQKLSKLQDSYSEALKEKLVRGKKGSRATHTSIKDFYSLVNSTNKNIREKVICSPGEGKRGWVSSAVELINKSSINNSENKIFKVENHKLKKEMLVIISENSRLRKLVDSMCDKIEYFRGVIGFKSGRGLR